MIDTNLPGGADITVPHPLEIPPTSDPIGIPVPQDAPPDRLPGREPGVSINDPSPGHYTGDGGDPLMP